MVVAGSKLYETHAQLNNILMAKDGMDIYYQKKVVFT